MGAIFNASPDTVRILLCNKFAVQRTILIPSLQALLGRQHLRMLLLIAKTELILLFCECVSVPRHGRMLAYITACLPHYEMMADVSVFPTVTCFLFYLWQTSGEGSRLSK